MVKGGNGTKHSTKLICQTRSGTIVVGLEVETETVVCWSTDHHARRKSGFLFHQLEMLSLPPGNLSLETIVWPCEQGSPVSPALQQGC